MNLDTIRSVERPSTLAQIPAPREQGDGWLAGGTWLFSEPQPHLTRLIDLTGLNWQALTVTEQGLQISATCTVAELYALEPPTDWTAAPLIRQCCESFQSSFKIWNAATVGGNICLSLPAGPMISLAAALDATATILSPESVEHTVPVATFVTGNRRNILQPGELLRSIVIPAAALRRRYAFRRMSMTRTGRSTVLLIGTLDPKIGAFALTITAAAAKPIQLQFERVPSADRLEAAISEATMDDLYLDDPHGSPVYRKHLTMLFAQEIRAELEGASGNGGGER